MIEIELSLGLAVIVDDNCPSEIIDAPWHAKPRKRTYYGRSTVVPADDQYSAVRVLLHRAVAIAYGGEIPPGCVVDHIDGCGWNNLCENLRVVPTSVNRTNRHTGRPTLYRKGGEISLVKGTSQLHGKWRYWDWGAKTWLGEYDNCLDAAMKYDESIAFWGVEEEPNFGREVIATRSFPAL